MKGGAIFYALDGLCVLSQRITLAATAPCDVPRSHKPVQAATEHLALAGAKRSVKHGCVMKERSNAVTITVIYSHAL